MASGAPPEPAGPGEGRPAVPSRPLNRVFVWLVLHLKYLIVPAWIAAALVAYVRLPALGAVEGGPLDLLAPKQAASLAVERQSLHEFGNVLLADTAVVQRDPHGLSLAAQRRAVQRAYAVDQGHGGVPGLRAAIPVLNTFGLFPGSRESSTTIVTYLFFSPNLSLGGRYAAAHAFARRLSPGDHLVGVTGPGPARWEQGLIMDDALLKVEIATLLVIAGVVTIVFRGLGAALVTLLTAGTAYIVSAHVLGWFTLQQGFAAPVELQPLLVVLLLAIVTDYSIFYLAGARRLLRAGSGRRAAARLTALEFTPTILFAGVTVAATAATLLAANIGFLRTLGPALAIAVLIGVLAAVTLVPALVAIFGRLLFWPGLGSVRRRPLSTERRAIRAARSLRGRVTGFIARPVVALPVVLVFLAALIGAAQLMRGLQLGVDLTSGLPPTAEAARAARAAGAGFAGGIVSPSVVLLRGPGLDGDRAGLVRLEGLLARQPGVAGVLGPREQLPGLPRAVFVNSRGDAARYVLVMDSDPYAGPAIGHMRRLQRQLPALLQKAGLRGASAGVAGGSALAVDSIDATYGGLWRVALAMALVDLLLLGLFLRSLLAPIYLLGASVLAVGAPIGIATYVFERLLHVADLSYFVPVAAGVLLVALGSDYTIFVVGRIAEEVAKRPRHEALRVAVPLATGAISTAGLTLAASFALLAIVPTLPFREFAFIMVVGVLIDSFLVRSYLVPSLVALLGRLRRWSPRRDRAAYRRPAL